MGAAGLVKLGRDRYFNRVGSVIDVPALNIWNHTYWGWHMGTGVEFQHECGKWAKGCLVEVACELKQKSPQHASDEIHFKKYFSE